MAYEINLDGIVGPTHNYAGLSHGNLASTKHAAQVSHPKQAALQGLAKMKALHDLGVAQAVLPPQPRPRLDVLRSLGFTGSVGDLLHKSRQQDPRLLTAIYSASAMWVANAGTVSPSADSADGRVHITSANLITQFHRSIEPRFTAALLKAIFPGDGFVHHGPLPAADAFADEGAANHLRMCRSHDQAGLEIFVYGRSETSKEIRFPARQTKQASMAIARRHGLDPQRTLFLQQSPAAIAAGAFHNDVVSTANQNVLLMHGSAFVDANAVDIIQHHYTALTGESAHIFVADSDELSLADAVSTYLFNCQVVTLPDGTMVLIAPLECRDHTGVQKYLARVLASGCPIQSVHYIDLRQSMQNGGGPACLRLRVALTPQQQTTMHAGVRFTDSLNERLVALVNQAYRDELTSADLVDPAFAKEAIETTEAMYAVLGLDITSIAERSCWNDLMKSNGKT